MTSPDYGVKLHLIAEIIIGGCHACTIEGYALSEPDVPELLEVCLIAEPTIDSAGRRLPVDDVGTVLSECELDPIRRGIAAALYREARKPENIADLREKWLDERRSRREEARSLSILAQCGMAAE